MLFDDIRDIQKCDGDVVSTRNGCRGTYRVGQVAYNSVVPLRTANPNLTHGLTASARYRYVRHELFSFIIRRKKGCMMAEESQWISQ